MKVGSKLALFRVELVSEKDGDKIYKATGVENFQVKTNYGKSFEQQFINNIIIYTDLDLEPANFDKELPNRVIQKKDGTPYEIKRSPLSFDRISNPENSIITVVDFEYKISNKRNKQGNVIYIPGGKKPYIVTNFIIYKCELDRKKEKKAKVVDSRDVEIKSLKKKYDSLEKKYEKLSDKNKELKSENRKLSKKLEKNTVKEKSDKKPRIKNVIKKAEPTFVEVNGQMIAMPTFDSNDLI